jgi:hypothetical protein
MAPTALMVGLAWGQVEQAQLCAAVWYRGPTCKNCYLRNKTEGGKQPKLAKTLRRRASRVGRRHSSSLLESVCREVRTLACSARPQPGPPALPSDAPTTCSVGVHRLSVIPRALVDRSNPGSAGVRR